MSNAIDAHLTDEVINAAFENTNFGRDDFRTILAETVMKRAAPQDEAKKDKPHNNFGTGARLTNHRFKV
ncbi:hypothetical protein ACBR19_22485 [Raoultella planticola]|uniref:hypothetical protein n=1 Tax=Raoultella planticola TaxID=575 RepID=UPI003525768E